MAYVLHLAEDSPLLRIVCGNKPANLSLFLGIGDQLETFGFVCHVCARARLGIASRCAKKGFDSESIGRQAD